MKVLVTILLGLLIVGCGTTQLGNATQKEDKAYQLALGAVKSRSAEPDFKNLRLKYAETADYRPYSPLSYRNLWDALDDKEYKKCLNLSSKILHKNYISLAAHFTAMVCNMELGNDKEKEFHRYMFDGLVGSISRSGDGQSKETAFETISTSEVYSFINILGYDVVKQALVQGNEKVYDLMTVKRPDNEEEFSMYFDVTLQMTKGMKF